MLYVALSIGPELFGLQRLERTSDLSLIDDPEGRLLCDEIGIAFPGRWYPKSRGYEQLVQADFIDQVWSMKLDELQGLLSFVIADGGFHFFKSEVSEHWLLDLLGIQHNLPLHPRDRQPNSIQFSEHQINAFLITQAHYELFSDRRHVIRPEGRLELFDTSQAPVDLMTYTSGSQSGLARHVRSYQSYWLRFLRQVGTDIELPKIAIDLDYVDEICPIVSTIGFFLAVNEFVGRP